MFINYCKHNTPQKFCGVRPNLDLLELYRYEKKILKFRVKTKKKIFILNLFLISRFLSQKHSDDKKNIKSLHLNS